MREFTLDEQTEISRAFDRGNSANAYAWLADCDLEDMPAHERAAFVLGYYSSYALSEIGPREIFDECYFSDTGQYVVTIAKYIDDRSDEYAADGEG